MTSQQVYDIVMKEIERLRSKDEKQDTKIEDNNKHINKLYVIIGKMGVKLGFIVSAFSLIGTTLGVILVKYVFKF